VSYRFEDTAELIGMSPANPKAHPGDVIHLTLYWRAVGPGVASWQAYVHSVESDVVRRDSLPATGNLLASDWTAGQTWAERYVVQIPASAPPQTVYTLIAGLYDPATGRTLDAVNAQGDPVAPVIGRIAINGPAHKLQPVYRFGSGIGLAQPRLTRQGDQLEVCLSWLSLTSPGVDYTVFVHVLDENSQPIAQTDQQPRSGAYPTGAWGTGETIDDCLTLEVPGLGTSAWHVELGLYALNDQGQAVRLPVRDAHGQPLPNDAVTVMP
jgi:hypothetical protein